jgi:hypothetical protein
MSHKLSWVAAGDGLVRGNARAERENREDGSCLTNWVGLRPR